MLGKTIGHYRILKELGEGGMGVVYQAEDTKLGRIVALKFLPHHMTKEKESIERFLHEARTASALDHNNICTILGIDQTDDGQLFISMSYYEGETLDRKLDRGRVKFKEAIEVATQICRALEKAHGKGIIHRDVKPTNIMITPEGVVKVLDFGVAKLEGKKGMTKTGAVLGTIEYMSPEQASGGKIDKRTDIWSLGVILFEMVCGKRPFQGENTSQTIWAIVNNDPTPKVAECDGIPLELERIINKCLEKKPGDRYQSAADLKTDLKRLKRDVQSGTVALTSTTTIRRNIRKTRRLLWLVSFIALAAVTALAAVLLFPLSSSPVTQSQQVEMNEMAFTQFTSEGGLASFPAWSPDGDWIVYASDEEGSMDLWKKPVGGGQAVRLTDSPFNEIQPAWSPDGKAIAFTSEENGGGILLIPADGGPAHRITDFGANPRWSPDGETIAFDSRGNIYAVPYSGGEPESLVTGTSSAPYMVWGPEGKKLIFWNRTKGDIFILDTVNREEEALGLVPSGQEVSGLAWSADGGKLVFSRGPFGGNKDLWYLAMDPETGNPISEPKPLTYSLTDDIQCSLSPDGMMLAFTVRSLERHLYSLPLDPATGLPGDDMTQLTRKGNRNYYPTVTADETMLAWTSHHNANGIIYAMDLTERKEIKVTQDWSRSTREVGPSFSPDGEQLAYGSTARGSYEVWRIPSIGGVALRITETSGAIRDTLTAWSPDGEKIAFYSNRAGNWDIWQVSAAGGEPQPITTWTSNELYPCWSPDGGRLAFRTDRDGNADIWITEFDGQEPRPFVTSPGEEGWSAWSPDGKWFYYLSDRGGVFNIWIRPGESAESEEDDSQQITNFNGLSFGMPEAALFGKFAVGKTKLILPLETRKGDIFILENFSPPDTSK